MTRHDRAFLEINMREHDAVGGYQPAVQQLVQAFFRHVVPTVKGDASFAHNFLPRIFVCGCRREGYTKPGSAGETRSEASRVCYDANPDSLLPSICSRAGMIAVLSLSNIW